MIVKHLNDLRGTDREVKSDGWISRRFLLADAGMGFSMHDTTILAGAELRMWYRNHLEAVYCVSGRGEIEDLATGDVHPIEDGVLYALDKHDQHILRAFDEMRMVCVFNPPLTGEETHGPDGAYPTAEEMRERS